MCGLHHEEGPGERGIAGFSTELQTDLLLQSEEMERPLKTWGLDSAAT
jgi:hypothetical protein